MDTSLQARIGQLATEVALTVAWGVGVLAAVAVTVGAAVVGYVLVVDEKIRLAGRRATRRARKPLGHRSPGRVVQLLGAQLRADQLPPLDRARSLLSGIRTFAAGQVSGFWTPETTVASVMVMVVVLAATAALALNVEAVLAFETLRYDLDGGTRLWGVDVLGGIVLFVLVLGIVASHLLFGDVGRLAHGSGRWSGQARTVLIRLVGGVLLAVVSGVFAWELGEIRRANFVAGAELQQPIVYEAPTEMFRLDGPTPSPDSEAVALAAVEARNTEIRTANKAELDRRDRIGGILHATSMLAWGLGVFLGATVVRALEMVFATSWVPVRLAAAWGCHRLDDRRTWLTDCHDQIPLLVTDTANAEGIISTSDEPIEPPNPEPHRPDPPPPTAAGPAPPGPASPATDEPGLCEPPTPTVPDRYQVPAALERVVAANDRPDASCMDEYSSDRRRMSFRTGDGPEDLLDVYDHIDTGGGFSRVSYARHRAFPSLPLVVKWVEVGEAGGEAAYKLARERELADLAAGIGEGWVVPPVFWGPGTFTRKAPQGRVFATGGDPAIRRDGSVGDARHAWVAYPLFPHGSLADRLAYDPLLGSATRRAYTMQLTTMLEQLWLHLRHLDLKPANLLLDAHDRLWLTDVEGAADLAAGDFTLGRHAFSPWYAPLEVLNRTAEPTDRFRLAQDLFGFGAIGHELLSGERPHESLVEAGLHGETLARHLVRVRVAPPEPPSLAQSAPGTWAVLAEILDPDPWVRFGPTLPTDPTPDQYQAAAIAQLRRFAQAFAADDGTQGAA